MTEVFSETVEGYGHWDDWPLYPDHVYKKMESRLGPPLLKRLIDWKWSLYELEFPLDGGHTHLLKIEVLATPMTLADNNIVIWEGTFFPIVTELIKRDVFQSHVQSVVFQRRDWQGSLAKYRLLSVDKVNLKET